MGFRADGSGRQPQQASRLIEAKGVPIDGAGGVLGQAGPTNRRPASAGASAFLPAKGIMQFDTDDLAQMEAPAAIRASPVQITSIRRL